MAQTIDLRKKEVATQPAEQPIEPAPESGPAVEVKTESTTLPEISEIRWSTHLFPPQRRNLVLYITIGLAVSAGLVAYFGHDFLFTTVLALAAIVLNLNAAKPRNQSEIAIHATGVSIDNQRHHFADMKSFWIDYQPNLKELSIELKKGYAPRIKVPLEDANPLEIRRTMLSYIPEKEHEQSLLDHIVRLIGI